ncbi:Type I iodothyronine deiodinase [Symbiodinium microadriaticum]|uniref:Type I iodothyronine deiodinase n=1 Tax=Symbiodinium microadriaticum TaxID=2951 RepID=A0A1Q9E777_SYMMI|nr:Type I iodothyronine deiodinase [Symbiodinium microadriaticum]
MLRELRGMGVFCAMVYLQEAHADDLWPLGYGIRSHVTLEDRIGACRDFLTRHSEFGAALDSLTLDGMKDEFLHTFGAWPMRYFVSDLTGNITWSSDAMDLQAHTPEDVSKLYDRVREQLRVGTPAV